MDARVKELIDKLGLQPHPEGGHFVEVFRSSLLVSPADSRAPRSALTVIYFLLAQGGYSRWHRVLSDEAWHWYEGDPLELLMAPPGGGDVTSSILGPFSENSRPLHIVPAEWWQAARPLGRYTLVGCSVGPGFDYSDFELLSATPKEERPVFVSKTSIAQLL